MNRVDYQIYLQDSQCRNCGWENGRLQRCDLLVRRYFEVVAGRRARTSDEAERVGVDGVGLVRRSCPMYEGVEELLARLRGLPGSHHDPVVQRLRRELAGKGVTGRKEDGWREVLQEETKRGDRKGGGEKADRTNKIFGPQRMKDNRGKPDWNGFMGFGR